MEKYCTTTTECNCGIDLHARQMYACVMDRQGKVLLHCNIEGNDFAYFLKRVASWRHDLTVVCECTFNWYWLADACDAAGITLGPSWSDPDFLPNVRCGAPACKRGERSDPMGSCPCTTGARWRPLRSARSKARSAPQVPSS